MEDYTLIKNGAQELDGKWKLAEYLGTEQEDGTINRSLLPTEQVELSLRILKRRKLHGNSLMVDKQGCSDRIHIHITFNIW